LLSPWEVLLFAFFIGVVAGLRSLTAPAAIAWAAHAGWIHLHGSKFAFMGSTPALGIFLVLALVELVADKLPNTPSRTAPPGLIARMVFGGLCGSCLAVAGSQPVIVGTLFGLMGGIAGAFGGYQIRTRLVKVLKAPDFVVAVAEDVVAIAAGLFVSSRF
jgi:uncharacterized membrane protein